MVDDIIEAIKRARLPKDTRTEIIHIVPENYRPLKLKLLNLFSGYTDAPEKFLEGAYWFIVSTLYGYYLNIPDIPKTKANVWVVISGRSFLTRKSTVINLAYDDFLKPALKSYLSAIYPNLSPSEIWEIMESMLIEGGSSEGIIDHLEQVLEERPELDRFILLSHEFGGVLSGFKSASYMKLLPVLLSKLYYSEPAILRFVKGTRRLPPAYTTALFGVQELNLYVDSLIFKQGLMRRLLIIYQTAEDRNKWYGIIRKDRAGILQKLKTMAEEIGRSLAVFEVMLKEKVSDGKITVIIGDEAAELLNNYSYRIEEEARTDNTLFSYYIPALEEYAIKIAILDAVVNNPIEIKKVDNKYEAYLVVEPSNVKVAMEFIESIKPRAKEIIVNAQIQQRDFFYTNLSPLQERIIQTVKSYLEKNRDEYGVDVMRLPYLTGIKASDLADPLGMLIQGRKLMMVMIEKKHGKGKRRKFIITIPQKLSSIAGRILTEEEAVNVIAKYYLKR